MRAAHDYRLCRCSKGKRVKKGLSRRKFITTTLGAAAGASGIAVAARIADGYGLIPPDHTGIFGIGETLTYASQRILTSFHSQAREFDRSQITEIPIVNGNAPQNEMYERLFRGKFADWRLTIDGLVARPSSFSLADLKRYPSTTHITQLACEEGWSFIAEWTGVALFDVLNFVGVLPQAKYVVYFSLDEEWWDSLDMPEAWHPQTLLTYAMNGRDLTVDHGAPLRLRLPRQLGYKSVKYVHRITLTDNIKKFGSGFGSVSPDLGYSWYAGI
jgi:DMSO/TMAO reductase YedYZ molybdopterin-dependent catalytic subunit